MTTAQDLLTIFDNAEKAISGKHNLDRFREAQEPTSRDDYHDVVVSYLSISELNSSKLTQEIGKAMKILITNKTSIDVIEAGVSSLSLEQLKVFYEKIKKEQLI